VSEVKLKEGSSMLVVSYNITKLKEAEVEKDKACNIAMLNSFKYIFEKGNKK